MNWKCQQCGGPFNRDTRKSDLAKYCGSECYRESRKGKTNAGSFSPGREPWNKGMKGLHLSPSTEFRKGQRSINRVPVGTVSIRKDKGKGKPRAFVKIAEPNVWELRAVLVWEAAHGPVPDGLILHHKDDDSLNDALGNLALLTRAQHIKEHEAQLRDAARKSPKRMGWGPGGKRVAWRRHWMQLEAK